MTSSLGKKSKRNLWFSYIVAIVSVFSVVHYTGTNWEDFSTALKSIEGDALWGAVGMFSIHLLLNAIGFALATRSLGVEANSWQLIVIWLASLAAKYIPGGVWHIVGRGALLVDHKVKVSHVAAVGLFEQMNSLLLCAGIVLFAIGWRLDSMVFFVGGGLVPAIGILGMIGIGSAADLPYKQPSLVWLSAFAYAVAMVPYATAYVVLCKPVAIIQFIEALFAGTIAGVLALPVPGGIGIRESATTYFANAVDADQILAGLIAARVVLLVLEITATTCAQAFRSHQRTCS